METPWGPSQTVKKIADGITEVSTAGHGGIHVRDDLLTSIPRERREWSARWSGSENWFEEDCAWAFVAVAFPVYFDAEIVRAAERTVDRLEGEEKC